MYVLTWNILSSKLVNCFCCLKNFQYFSNKLFCLFPCLDHCCCGPSHISLTLILLSVCLSALLLMFCLLWVQSLSCWLLGQLCWSPKPPPSCQCHQQLLQGLSYPTTSPRLSACFPSLSLHSSFFQIHSILAGGSVQAMKRQALCWGQLCFVVECLTLLVSMSWIVALSYAALSTIRKFNSIRHAQIRQGILTF